MYSKAVFCFMVLALLTGIVAEGTMAFVIESPAFENGREIPSTYTCQGRDVSPPLSWSGVPSGARSLALIVSDPDAPDPANPRMTWVHWVLYNLPADSAGMPEGAGNNGTLPDGTMQGVNDWGRTGYGGPCPPIGSHRYFFRLYALDKILPDLGAPSMKELLHAMKGHVIGEAELMGRYEKK